MPLVPAAEPLLTCCRVKEEIAGASIEERAHKIGSFQDLGPPDSLNLFKHLQSSKTTEIGTFLYYTGVDTSSSSSIAAHLHSVAQTISDSPQSWFGKAKPWKVSKAVYTTYNAFSHCDVSVTVNFPGTVTSYIINEHGEKIDENDDIWLETFTSGIIRSLLTKDEDEEQVSSIVESRNINPFQSVEIAELFLNCFEKFFLRGPDLGSAPEIQTTTLISNYLVDAFLKCVEITKMYDHGLKVLENLKSKYNNNQVLTLIVKLLLLQDEEIKAVKLMNQGLLENPRDASLLILQSEFLSSKKNYKLALKSAICAVNSSPSEFIPWYNLSKIYLELDQIEESLLTLNSCPMSAFKEKFHLKRIISTSTENLHLPLPLDVTLPDVSSLDSAKVAQEHQSIDQSLVNLQSANLKSTFAKVYQVLTLIVNKTGWESLLKYRAKLFVMEDEYKNSIDDKENETLVTKEFKKKRLCERWLDNLFMLLYEDLRTYTMWQAELIHFQAQNSSYTKLPIEWELLGMCAFRLNHFKEAKFAFQKCLEARFAPTSTRNLLKIYLMDQSKLIEKINNNSNFDSVLNNKKKINSIDFQILNLVIKLSIWNHRWYCEFSPNLIKILENLVKSQGLIKISNEILGNWSEEDGVYKFFQIEFELFKKFNIEGVDY